MKRCHRFCPALVFPGAVLLALTVLLSLILPAPVGAQTDAFVPYVSVRQEYSDNIVFSRYNEEDDFITSGSAGMVYTHRDARVRALLDAREQYPDAAPVAIVLNKPAVVELPEPVRLLPAVEWLLYSE